MTVSTDCIPVRMLEWNTSSNFVEAFLWIISREVLSQRVHAQRCQARIAMHSPGPRMRYVGPSLDSPKLLKVPLKLLSL
eukprot:4848669-Amphidinium_carterae.1